MAYVRVIHGNQYGLQIHGQLELLYRQIMRRLASLGVLRTQALALVFRDSQTNPVALIATQHGPNVVFSYITVPEEDMPQFSADPPPPILHLGQQMQVRDADSGLSYQAFYVADYSGIEAHRRYVDPLSIPISQLLLLDPQTSHALDVLHDAIFTGTQNNIDPNITIGSNNIINGDLDNPDDPDIFN